MLQISSESGIWSGFVRQIEQFLAADQVSLVTNGVPVKGYRSPDSPALWIRDHSDIMRGGVFFEPDVQSAVAAFAGTQAPNGRIFDNVSTRPTPTERENWEKWIRVQVEADVEFRFVKAGYLAWQACGDNDWLAALLPAFDSALNYSRTHPWRWDPEHQLMKRAYTIDTWDFDYTAGKYPWLNFQITDDTFWGLFHGDNSGLYEAALLLAKMYRAVGEGVGADEWEDFARRLRDRANHVLFNGSYYTHFVKLVDVTIPGVDEASQLSLSTPMAINRGMATHEIAVAIIREYQRRKESTGAFAEWFGIDPPFPDGVYGDEKLVAGAYINGGIFPLTGGELARAALTHGFEKYGVDILRQYADMIAESGETYLWYFPDGTPSSEENSTSPEAMPTDGWGSSSMLWAFIEGLCGIVDLDHSYRQVLCSPRWLAAGESNANIHVGYAASGAGFGYAYQHDESASCLEMTVEGNASVQFHVLLPAGIDSAKVTIAGKETVSRIHTVEQSLYADFQHEVNGKVHVLISYKKD